MLPTAHDISLGIYASIKICCMLQVREQLQLQSYCQRNLAWASYFVITSKNMLLNIVFGMYKQIFLQVSRFQLNLGRASGELKLGKKLFYFYLHPIKRQTNNIKLV